MAKKASKTGSGPTFIVAMEQLYPKEQRIMDDPSAYGMMETSMKAFYMLVKSKRIRDWMIRSSERDLPGIWGGLLGRKCFVDDALDDHKAEMRAVVNLGAGLDTRAFRLKGLEKLKIWEIDQPANIASKVKLILKNYDAMPHNMTLLPVDFDNEDTAERLESSGYSFHMKTFFIMEGVTQYLTDEGIESTFNLLSKAASGSMLAFTYIPKDFIEGTNMFGQEAAYKKYVLKDKMWLFGKNHDEWPAYLEEKGWEIIEDIDGLELHRRYIEPRGRQLLGQEVERSILAVKR